MATPVAPDIGSLKRPLRILYADDMRELRDVLRISLTREGHGVECVADGLSAFERIAADPAFDLVISDHHMPKMNGLELLAQLRTLPFHGKTMIFSSELSPSVAAGYHRLGVDRILYKPVFPSVLRQILAEMFPPAPPAPADVI